MDHNYEYEELIKKIEGLKKTFDLVRLVEPVSGKLCEFLKDKNEIKVTEYECYSLWDKNKKCKNCVSIRALLDKTRYTKFEFVNDDIYFVLAKYVKVLEREYVLEMAVKLNSQNILSSSGKSEFVNLISNINKDIYKDELTGVYNRKYLTERLPAMVLKSQYNSKQIGVAIIDIDYFKNINDTYGHQIGDEIIKAVSNILQSTVSNRRGDFVSRPGGDEFVVVFDNIEKYTFRKRLEKIIKKSRDFMFNENLKEGEKIKISISIGGALSSEIEDFKMKPIISLADERLYNAKKNGRDQMNISPHNE